MGSNPSKGMNKRWTKEYLSLLVKDSNSISDVIRKAGNKPSGGMHRMISGYITSFSIDTSHFDSSIGKAWSKGKTSQNESRIKKTDLTKLFVKNGTANQSYVRRKYVEVSEYTCAFCKTLPVWRDKPLTLHMDHINGNHLDHRLENLRWLCPNCHSQTTTYGNKRL